MKRIVIIFFTTLFLSHPAFAEIEKVANMGDNGINLYWWPKLPAVKGWHHEREASYEYGANAQAPDGSNFNNAETVIYALALYKPRTPETKSLEILIEDDKQKFLSEDPQITISEVDPLKTADGKILRSFTFFPKEKGNWEQVSYGEEGDFYIVFTVSSRTKDGLREAMDAYKQFMSQYREKP